jgi:hypothetical protein
VSPALLPLVAALATYALVSTVLASGVLVAWRRGVSRLPLRANQLLALRLLPAIGGALVTLTVQVPAFIRFEPSDHAERAGPLALALALAGLLMVADGARRTWRAVRATRRIARAWSADASRVTRDGASLDLIDADAPVVAIVGLWRFRVVVAASVVKACTPDEFAQVVAHERAHGAARDNLKRLLMTASPDVLAWLPAERSIGDRWHAAAERAADERAAGASREARLALASALVKVARLAVGGPAAPTLANALIGIEDIEGRVRRLLAPDVPAPHLDRSWLPVAAVAFLPGLALPVHEHIHALAEAVIAFGR